jgi:antitoxin HicB
MVLTLTPAKEGGYVVTSPLDPEVITEAETVPEAFQMARDAVRTLRVARAKLLRKLAAATCPDTARRTLLPSAR